MAKVRYRRECLIGVTASEDGEHGSRHIGMVLIHRQQRLAQRGAGPGASF